MARMRVRRTTQRDGTGGPLARDDGAAALEFALVLPLLLVLVFGIMQYGLFFSEESRAEYGLGQATEAAELGEVSPTALEDRVLADSGADWVLAIGVCFRDTDVSGDGVGVYSRRDALEVSLQWQPTSLQLPLVPFLGSGPRTERTVGTVRAMATSAPPACET